MLRNILLKLPVLTTISDIPASPCNVRVLRSLSPTVRECRRDTKKNASRTCSTYAYRRSYSFPSEKPKTSKLSNRQQSVNRHDLHQRVNASTMKQQEHPEIERCRETQKSKAKSAVSAPVADEKKYYDNYEVTEQYELEASKPRKSQSELAFNVFDYIEKLESEYDPINHLQPNNLRPFGSMDNVYYPVMMRNKDSNVLQYPQSYADETELPSSVKRTKTKDDLQHREFSTNTRAFHSKPQGPMDLIENLPPFDESGHYMTIKPKPKQSVKKPVVVKSFPNKPKPNKEIEEALGVAQECKKKLFKSKYTCEENSKNNVYESFKLPWCEDQMLVDTEGEPATDLNERTTPKRPTTKLTTPWLSYSDTLKNITLEDAEESNRLVTDNTEIMSPADRVGSKPITILKRTLSTEAPQLVDTKSRNNHENILQRQNSAGNFQNRNLATDSMRKNNFTKNAKTHLHVSAKTLSMEKKLLASEKTYVKTNNYTRTASPLEPKSCEKPPQKKKCFLPSKVRLKPPKCTPTPPPCPIKEPCERSDDCLKLKPKKLPLLKVSDCPCVEPVGPEINPKMKRLSLRFTDPPRVCPEIPRCRPRADDNLSTKPKKLVPLKPGDCVCVEPPPMTDVKFKRLQKTCVPEGECYPKPECPPPPPCLRADDCLKVHEKPLPQLIAGYCPCIEPEVPDRNPKLRRLEFCFKDPPKPKICEPINPCPPRADDQIPEKFKKLPKFEPSNCLCMEPPPLVNIPLKRLQKTCVPEEKCYPKKECPIPEPCIRADDCWKPKLKPLPVIKGGPCICVEPFIPDKIPKLKRLDIECKDQPRPLSCYPVNLCPPRADDSVKPKTKKLPFIATGDCKCVEAPPMVDIPLKRLQKICEPEETCYPKKDCPLPEPCLRADDTLCTKARSLPLLEAKECPCVESPPFKDAPALKRLELKVCEPPKVCPKPMVCEDISRADDHWWEKAKKLPTLKSGDCPCIDQPMVEAPPLKKLVCEDGPDECYEIDPCMNTPRADMGCWEYYRPEEQKCDSKKKKGVSYNSKRRYNTDSRLYLFNEIRNAVTKKKFENPDSAVGTSRFNKVATKEAAKIARASSIRSDTTMTLLKELKDLEDTEMAAKKRQSPAHQDPDRNISGTFIRHLSTIVPNMPRGPVKQKKGLNMKMPVENKKKPKCHKVGSPCTLAKLPCASTKCPINCEKERTPVCCDKKSSPYPAFSELTQEEIEPFSETTEYTCDRKEYGFYPRYKKLNDPLMNDKNKKKYSTLAAKERNTQKDNDSMSKVNLSSSNLAPVKTRLEINGNLYQIGQLETEYVNPIHKTVPAMNIKEPKLTQLLKQKANYGIVGLDNGILRISQWETSPALSRLRTTPCYSRNISVHTKNSYYPSNYLIRNKSFLSKKDKCRPKRSKCPKFKMDNCPQPTLRPNCQRKRPIYVCEKEKSRAPYPAFTDCLDEELAENLAECPLERDKVRQLQPCLMNPLDRPNLTKPVEPIVGKIDPLKEHECVKAKLAIRNQGLSQSCENFGKFEKVMKARDHLREVNRDCAEIEKLRKLGKWPPRYSRGLCTTTANIFCMQKRGICKCASNPKARNSPKTPNPVEKHESKQKQPTSSLTFNACPKTIYVRKYHVLCTKPEKKIVDNLDIKMNEVSQYRLTEDDSYKFMKLRNVQWRINNFQKWHRLQRLNSSPDCNRKLCSSTSLGVKRHSHLGHSQKPFSTSATRQVSLPEPLEVPVHRGIATTYILARADGGEDSVFSMKGKCPKGSKSYPKKFSLPHCPKKKRKSCQWKYSDRHCKKLDSPYPAFSECRDYEMDLKNCECPLQKEQIQQLQPQYPILPEISSGSLPEPLSQPKIDVSIEEEYARHKYGLEKEGLTLDCSTFGFKRKPLTYKIAKEEFEKIKKHVDDDDEHKLSEEFLEVKEVASCSAHTEWCRSDKIYSNPPRRTLADDCCRPTPKIWVEKRQEKNKCDSENKPAVVPTKCVEQAKPKETMQANTNVNPCLCKLNTQSKKEEVTIWQKVVNYFKARPNCPAPGDWKKQAAREKAEKYAKAAGLVVCDPKDLPMKKPCAAEDLPKVITPKCPKFPFTCDSGQGKRSFSTICVIQDHLYPWKQAVGSRQARNLHLITQNVSLPSICHRWYSTGPLGDEDRQSLDGEENLTQKKEMTNSDKGHLSTLRASENDAENKNMISSLDVDEKNIAKHYSGDSESNAFDENLIDEKLFDTDQNIFIDAYTAEEDECSLSDRGGVRKWSSEGIGKKLESTRRRYFSSHINWRNLEDINKSLEEEEKKRLAKEILKPYTEGATISREQDFEDDLDDNVQRNFDQNRDVYGNNQIENDDEAAGFSRHVVQRKSSSFDAIFHEPQDDVTGYNQARAFAAFQDFFHKIEVLSDVNYEEVESNKTKNLVQELNKLMGDENQDGKE